MKIALWWVRRDLRLHDNPALQAALKHGAVIPVFVVDPAASGSRYHRRAERRRAFLYAGLRALDAELRRRGSGLIVREGDPRSALAGLLSESGASTIHAAEDYSPYAHKRDQAIQRELPLTLHAGPSVHHPTVVQKPAGGPYTVFTPFSRAWKGLPPPAASDLLPAPEAIPKPAAALPSLALPELPVPAEFPPGEAEARRRLQVFCGSAIHAYGVSRDRLDLDGTSALSPYFRFGMLSAREAVAAAGQALQAAPDATARQGAEAWLNELIWREFYLGILYHFPQVLTRAFNPGLRRIAWREAVDDFEAWKAGRTGYPVVDAGMRQLAATGWMHNRARMIVASFLVKDLLIDWRRGEQWFMDQLVDGDLAANNGGWQWTAGTGTDAAPYFRIFNPVRQGERFDPLGGYVRRFVPELRAVPDKYLHAPWTMPLELQRACGVIIGQHYPQPIVARDLVRARTLAAYQRSKRA